MLRRLLTVLVITLALAGCGDDEPATIEREVPGNTVIERLEAAMQKAGTGRARRHDGSAEYWWDLRKPGRLLLLNHQTRVESRKIGDLVYQRAAPYDVWVRLPFDEQIRPVAELSFFKDRDAIEVSKGGTVLQYVVEVPARLVDGRSENPGGDDALEVTIILNGDGLPLRSRIEGNGTGGTSFSDWGEEVTIERPAKSVKGTLKND